MASIGVRLGAGPLAFLFVAMMSCLALRAVTNADCTSCPEGEHCAGSTDEGFRCVVDRCGDGHLAPAEQCDDGPANSDTAPDACRTDCSLPPYGQ